MSIKPETYAKVAPLGSVNWLIELLIESYAVAEAPEDVITSFVLPRR